MIGTTISHYTILEKLGEGGMGVVYRAHDTKLDRFVALKFLPPHLSASEADKARFVQEAKAASALNHPNVCTIHDIQEHDGQLFIVMEFVDGQTLGEKRGALSFKQAIDIGIQVADGVAAAHERGIVHRDIKPENIMVRKDGIAQIMDFGLAKLKASGSKITRLTKEGSTVGTAGYMSPEQVQGHDADHRSDIFSYGVLLYEMLTGQLPFRGVHETALAYEIVNVDALPMSAVKPEIDPSLDAIVLECLEKDQNERTQSAKQIAIDLKRYRRESSRQKMSRITAARPVARLSGAHPVDDTPSTLHETSSHSESKRSLLPWILTGVFIVVSGFLSFLHFREPVADSTVLRAYIHPPDSYTFASGNGGHIALSPNGQMLTFVGRDSTGKNALWVRAMRSLSAQQLAGTDGAQYPFWSPDNRQIAFFADGKLKKIDAAGGPVLNICDAPQGRGGAWNAAGTILFAPTSTSGLLRVSAAGGATAAVTRLEMSQVAQSHRFPIFLPDGDHFLFSIEAENNGASDRDSIIAGSLSDSTFRKVLLHASSNTAFARGQLLYFEQKTLMARSFDADHIRFDGNAVPVAEDILYVPARIKASFSASETGILLYQTEFTSHIRMTIVDRTGREVKSFFDRTLVGSAKLSKDGKTIAYGQDESQKGTSDIWLYDIARSIPTRFTFDPAAELNPVWSPDGASIVYTWVRGAYADLYVKNANGTDTARVLYSSNFGKTVSDWSSDGRFIVFSGTVAAKMKVDLFVLPLFGDRKPIEFLKTEFNEGGGKFSPDGRWIAYLSDASGRLEIYIRPFPSGAERQISKSGAAIGPCYWRRDGKEIFYVTANRKIVSVGISAKGNTLDIGNEQELFDLDARGPANLQDMTGDAKSFLVTVAPAARVQPVTIVTNWDAELKKK